MAERIRYIEARVETDSHELIVKIGDTFYSKAFSNRLTETGVARALRELAAEISAGQPDPLVSDLAMMMRRLVQRLRTFDANDPVASQAMTMLTNRALKGSILRDGVSDVGMAAAYVRKMGRASISALQREFHWGYSRAAKVMGELAELGVVSEPKQDGSRDVLPHDEGRAAT